MPSLRERLAGLAATRMPAAQVRSSHRTQTADATAEGTTTEQFLPLTARAGLAQLASADEETTPLLFGTAASTLPPPTEWLFLDTETTGLAGGTGTYAFLVGVGRLTAEGFLLRQIFLDDLAEERAFLAELQPMLDHAAVLVTYNGKLFDAPLLDTRFRLARMPYDFARLPHLDLLYPARRLWKLRWGTARLAELERHVLAHVRPADVPGELIPSLYFDYLRDGSRRRLELVFRHNAEDVVTLAALAGRLLHLLAAPEVSTRHPVELFSLARFFERARQLERAAALYERALAGQLPDDVGCAARYRLSLLYKRRRDYRRALELWQELLAFGADNGSNDNLAVYEELAICYEHRLDDPEAAREATRHALGLITCALAEEPENGSRYRRARQRFTRRLDRLARKKTRARLLRSA